MIALPWYLVLAGALALLTLVLMARRASRAAAHLQTSRDQAVQEGQRAYAQGHEDGLSEAYRRVDGMGANANAAYDNGYAAGLQAAQETEGHRRNGRRTISA